LVRRASGPWPAQEETALLRCLSAHRRHHPWTRRIRGAAGLERVLTHLGYLGATATTRNGGEAGELLHAVDSVRPFFARGGSLAGAADMLAIDAELARAGSSHSRAADLVIGASRPGRRCSRRRTRSRITCERGWRSRPSARASCSRTASATAASRSTGAASGDGTEGVRHAEVNGEIGRSVRGVRPARTHRRCVPAERVGGGEGLCEGDGAFPLHPVAVRLSLNRLPVALDECPNISGVHDAIIAPRCERPASTPALRVLAATLGLTVCGPI
jgi:hypothetical protein